ncbi:cohesin domain-containing protein [Thalassotalea hakodatensis]|uniref:cohesin domain-containing protein n=1 Tax=Thalassotalea hakodatensis TaxID=3030492 RepID=UPI002572519F|nr:cohesin domain-containing protein [Thalassotalea hakodatensis]
MKSFIISLLTLFTLNCHATLIELKLDQTSYQQGDTVTATIVAKNFPYTLGGFAGEMNFDDNALALTSWQFGQGFDDGFGSYSHADDSIDGSLYLEDYADLFADEPTITAIQGNEFVLATIAFTAVGSGQQTLSLLNGFEVLSFDNTMLDQLQGMAITFDVTSVPTPASIALFSLALLLLHRVKR